MDGEFTKVGDNPLTPEFFRHCGGCAGAAEKIGHQVAFVGGGKDDALEQGFGFLGGEIDTLGYLLL